MNPSNVVRIFEVYEPDKSATLAMAPLVADVEVATSETPAALAE